MVCRRSLGEAMSVVRPEPCSTATRFRILAAVVLVAALPRAVPAEGGRLAATANGQTIFGIDGERRAIEAFDTDRPASRRTVVGPAATTAPRFIAVGCLGDGVVAAVCRDGEEWSLRTFRTAPDGAVDAASPLQVVAIGRASGGADGVDLAVSHARGWLAVVGLPEPLPPVLRAVVATLRVGPLSDRHCPAPTDGVRPVAAAVSPVDELVLLLRPAVVADDELAYYDSTGRELLRLTTGVRATRGIDFNRTGGTLWALATDARGRQGLWRLDAALAEGRQVVRPAFVAAVGEPIDLACPTPRAIIVAAGRDGTTITSIDPAANPTGARP